MDIGTLLFIVLSSSVIAAVVTKTLDFLMERNRREAERRRSFYGPLKTYLTIADANKRRRKRILVSAGNKLRRLRKRKDEDSIRELFIAQNKRLGRLTNEFWRYIRNIYNLIEEYPDQIKEEHRPLFQDFLYAYITREDVGQERPSAQEAQSRIFDPEEIEADEQIIVDVLDKMKREFLGV